MLQLHAADLVSDGKNATVTLGAAERGQNVKTGTNQGVVISRGWVADLALACAANVTDGLMFLLTSPGRSQRWHKAGTASALPPLPPLHSIRHTAPSEDLARDRLDLESARRRDRWMSLGSVQRYTKTHLLVKFKQAMARSALLRGS